ncbi:uroporphyrinogen III methyltransferase [Chondromyces crocatus]|uniref:Uroporphyrinogen III methyltransferase n=2 Tax=Chondromyces crocatus TaxID=52 RepID=A0A0K1EQ17_CHOCO|nr:uroporphyrinogen III methyltransferase [Chondromyces crocatus]
MGSLVQRHGGKHIPAPTLREVVVDRNEPALAFAGSLQRREVDVVVLMTGVGTRALAAEVETVLDRAHFAEALSGVQVVVRGPKPAAALRELGVKAFVTVPEPNTWREVLDVLGVSAAPLAGKRIAVQEYGAPNRELYAALEAAGAAVVPVPIYRWALPEDTAPLRRALHALAAGEASIVLFTSRPQIEHFTMVAAEEGILAEVRAALTRGVVASIGPVCSEALRAEGLPPDLEPEHPKMGHLVKETAARAGEILERKAAARAQESAARGGEGSQLS